MPACPGGRRREGKVSREQPAQGVNQVYAQRDCPDGADIRNVDIHTPANLAGILAERGAEECRTEGKSRQLQRIHRICQPFGLDERGADGSKGRSCAAPLRNIGSRKHAGSVVNCDGIRRRQVGAWSDKRKPRVRPEHGTPQPAAGDYGQVAGQRICLVAVACQLAQRQTVADRHPHQSDEGDTVVRLPPALCHQPAQRIGAVKHAQRYPVRGAGTHGAEQRGGIGEVARSDILHIEHQHIQIPQTVRTRRICRVCPVRAGRKHHILKEGVGIQSGQLIASVRDFLAGTQHPAHAMLRREQAGYREQLWQYIDRTAPAVTGRYAGHIGNKPQS